MKGIENVLTYDTEHNPFWIVGSRWECIEVIDFAIREMFCIEYGDLCEINVFSYNMLGGTDKAISMIKQKKPRCYPGFCLLICFFPCFHNLRTINVLIVSDSRV